MFVPVERIVQDLASFPLWGIKREHGPIRSPSSPSAMRSPEKKAKNKPKKQQKQHQTTKQEKPHYRSGQDSSMRIPAASVLNISLACIETTPRTETARRWEGGKKTHSTLRKPGVPPARIPEITTRRPQSTTSTTIPKAIMRHMRESMDHQQAPCRGKQCKHKFSEQKWG